MIRKRESVAVLRQRIIDLEAQIASRCSNAIQELNGARIEKMQASAIILTITALGGRQIVPPVAIRDGLSDVAINALQDDLLRSYSLATLNKPKGKQP
jgi:hypothetical protein